MGKTKSIFKFVHVGSEIEVWCARIFKPEEEPKFQLIGRVTDNVKFWQLVQSHLEMQDDGMWGEPAVYKNGVWI